MLLLLLSVDEGTTILFVLLLLMSIFLSAFYNYANCKWHEMKHAKAIKRMGYTPLIIIPKKLCRKVKVKYRHGIKIFYIPAKYENKASDCAITLSSDDFQRMTDYQIKKAVGAGLNFSIRYVIIHFLCSGLSIIYFLLHCRQLSGMDLFLLVIECIFLCYAIIHIIDLLKIYYRVKVKRDYEEYNDIAAINNPSGFRQYTKAMCISKGCGLYEYYNSEYDELS